MPRYVTPGSAITRACSRPGCEIFEYQPRFLHLKMVLVDDWVSLGSCNFDHWNLRWNLDANLEAFDPQLAAEAAPVSWPILPRPRK